MPDADPIQRLNAALEGRYRIERELGEGGMATVYLAEDLRHNRDVALKVLKPELGAVVGSERFLAEIETTAKLQHPHILPLFDSGEADGLLFYVMPYVAGESLRERLDREHQLPVEDAVRIATNLAEALEYAHRQGVIHRDIKPANVLLQDGKALISDFGIALAVSAGGGDRITETGLSLGTPHYMSPEQATGDQAVGPATDIWALGCVLYEMLVGEPPYTGGTPQSILGQIITADVPSASDERRTVPPNVEATVAKALEKLPADRFTTGADVVSALNDPGFAIRDMSDAHGGAGRFWRKLSLAASAVAVLSGVLAVHFYLSGRRAAPDAAGPVERFRLPFDPGQEAGMLDRGGFALSPDGSMLVYRHGRGDLWVRRWEELQSTPVRGTLSGSSPAVSPDGLELAFERGESVMALAFAGGPVRTLGSGCCPEWGPDGSVYFTTDAGAVGVVGSGAGTVDVISRPADNEARHLVSDVLPDGRRALLEVRFPDGRTEIRGLDLRSGDTTFVTESVHPRYLSSGYLVYGSDAPRTTVMAARFDPGRMEILGAPVPAVQDVRAFSLSDHGKLYYTYGPEQLWNFDRTVELIWVTRSGEATPIDPEWTYIRGGSNHGWSLSPDGTRLALREFTQGNGNDIWIKRLDRGPRSRLTFHESEDRMPVWTPDGQDITFMSNRAGGMDVWSKPADMTGDAELVLDHDRDIAGVSWSPDGEWLLARTRGPGGAPGSRDILAYRPGVDTAATPLLAAPGYDERDASISPDGRYIAYTSNETGRDEVYVRPFPDVDADRWQISTEGGSDPIWAYRGRELFFVSRRRMMVVDVNTSSGFQHGPARVLFEFESDWINIPAALYQLVTPDDQRFVLARDLGRAADGTLMAGGVLVNNFVAEIEGLVSR